jgi:carotenoid cleavage dioxygenase-like enzyme
MSSSSPSAAGFESLERETDGESLDVEGTIPEWLSGRLLRTGPAKFEVGDETYNHWFDGLAMLHRFGLRDGDVSYRNRFLRSGAFEDATAEERIVRSEFGTDPCRSIFGRIMSFFSQKPVDNGNVNVAAYGDAYVSMTETPFPIAFDPDTLKTLGPVPATENPDADMSTAHPVVDRDAGRAINVTLAFGRTSSYGVVERDFASGDRRLLREIETDDPSYLHSFGVTDEYVVLAGFPLVFDTMALLLRSGTFADALEWKPELGTRFWAVQRSDGELAGQWRGPARFGFHHVNAFEVDGELQVDVAAYDDATIVDDLYLDRLRSADTTGPPAGHLERFHLPLDGSSVDVSRRSDTRIELPRIDDRRATRDYRYVWGGGQRKPDNFIDQIVRIDIDSGDAETWHQPGCYPGEPVFVERPDAAGEADGVLLTVVLDAERDSSFLAVLDAESLDEVGRARVPHHIPFQFHGNFYSEETS